MSSLTRRWQACRWVLVHTTDPSTILRHHNQQSPLTLWIVSLAMRCIRYDSPITKPHGTVREVDKLTHRSTFRQAIIVYILRVVRFRCDPNTRRIGRNGSDVEPCSSIGRLVERRITSTAKEQSRLIVVGRGQGSTLR